MTSKKPLGFRSDSPECEYLDSILDILDEEIAVTGTNPENHDPSDETDSLVSDLLGYLKLKIEID